MDGHILNTLNIGIYTRSEYSFEMSPFCHASTKFTLGLLEKLAIFFRYKFIANRVC